MRLRTLFLYLMGNRQAMFDIAGDPRALWVGLLFVLSTGLAREYDGEDLLHEPWYALIPLGASVVSSFALYLVTYGVVCMSPARGLRPSFLNGYRSFLGLFWMTAPLAWLYAVPYERFLPPLEATRANLITLAVVAAWRVILMMRVVGVLMGYGLRAIFLVMAFADGVVILALNFLPFPLIDIMGGLRLTPEESLIRGLACFVALWGTLSLPIWGLGSIVAWAFVSRNDLAWPAFDDPPKQGNVVLTGFAVASVAVWFVILPFTQPEQILRRRVEQLMDRGEIAAALRLMSEHERGDFPPHWDPPPHERFGPDRPPLESVLEAMAAEPPAPWVRAIYDAKVDTKDRRIGFAFTDLDDAERVTLLGSGRGRHWGSIWCITFSPDGKIIATGGMDKVIRLWDAQTLEPVSTLRGHTEMIETVAFSPDGNTLASGSFDKTIRIWDLKAAPPRERLVLRHDEPPGVSRVAFFPDSKTLVSGAFTLRFWDLTVNAPVERNRVELESGVSALAFAPDGKTMATTSQGDVVVIWDVTSGSPVRKATIQGANRNLTAVAFSPDGNSLACGSLTPNIELWDLEGEKPRKKSTWQVDSERVACVTFTRDGNTLVSGSEDGVVQLWDLRQKQPARLPLPAKMQGSKVALSPDGKILAAAGYDGTIRIWRLDGTSITELAPMEQRQKPWKCVAFAADSNVIACGGTDGTIQLWEFRDNRPQERCAFPAHAGPVSGVAFSLDGTRLASSSQDRTVLLWDLKEKTPRQRGALEHTDEVFSIAFGHGGILATGSYDLRLWDVGEAEPRVREVIAIEGSRSPVVAVRFTPDGKRLVAANRSGMAMVWDVSSNGVVKRAAIQQNRLTSVAIAADGNRLALGTHAAVSLWSLGEEGATEREGIDPDGLVSALSYAPQRLVLATATKDGGVTLWKGQERLGGWNMRREVFDVQFAPDGRHLAIATSNGVVILRPH